jgi:hypothetical protein
MWVMLYKGRMQKFRNYISQLVLMIKVFWALLLNDTMSPNNNIRHNHIWLRICCVGQKPSKNRLRVVLSVMLSDYAIRLSLHLHSPSRTQVHRLLFHSPYPIVTLRKWVGDDTDFRCRGHGLWVWTCHFIDLNSPSFPMKEALFLGVAWETIFTCFQLPWHSPQVAENCC